ncbi:hypothetical protein Tco_0882617 [Tanacetum coccineum]
MREFVIAQKTANDLSRKQSTSSKPSRNKDKRIIKLRFKTLKQSLVEFLITNLQDPPGTLPSNTQTNPKPSTSNEKPYRPPPARNEHVNAVFTRGGKTYNPPANPNTKTAVFLDDSKDEVEKVKKEAEPLPKKPTQTDTPPLKACKPKIPYPQCLNKEKMEA